MMSPPISQAAIAVRLLGALVLAGSATAVARQPEASQAAVDKVFSDLTAPGSPGCAVGVAENGATVYEHGYGLANVEAGAPIRPDTVFDIGSTSKQFTAASILLLEQQGKLSVKDDVRKFIPELPRYGATITLLHLLNHTSGLRDYLLLFHLAGFNGDSVTTDDEALALVARQKALNFTPGAEHLYSNTGYFLLALVVKRASGQTLPEYAAEHIFKPLGMTHTRFRDDHTLLMPGRAQAYDSKTGGAYRLDVSYFEQTGDGAVHTTVGDLLKWDENFYTARVGGAAVVAALQQPGVLNSGRTIPYAKGLVRGTYRGLPCVSHGGSWGGYRAELIRFPQQHLSVATLCNLGASDPGRRARQVAAVFLGNKLTADDPATSEDDDDTKAPKKTPYAPPARLWNEYPGVYRSDELRVAYTLAARDGSIRGTGIRDFGGLPKANTFPVEGFAPTALDEFTSADTGATLTFRRNASGRITGFRLDAGRVKNLVFTRSAPVRTQVP